MLMTVFVPFALISLRFSAFEFGAVLAAAGAGSLLGSLLSKRPGYRRAITPDALQGRMHTTMRSVNRAMIVVGAPVGGQLADTVGYRPIMWIAVAGLRWSPSPWRPRPPDTRRMGARPATRLASSPATA